MNQKKILDFLDLIEDTNDQLQILKLNAKLTFELWREPKYNLKTKMEEILFNIPNMKLSPGHVIKTPEDITTYAMILTTKDDQYTYKVIQDEISKNITIHTSTNTKEIKYTKDFLDYILTQIR